MFKLYLDCFSCSIDASKEDGTLGRLANDNHKSPNCKVKKVVVEGIPHLCLFAIKEIFPNEEITYNYGDSTWPWRSMVRLFSVAQMSKNTLCNVLFFHTLAKCYLRTTGYSMGLF